MKPNLFVLGAGKSGTSSLFHILKQHPDIHASPIKEPSFFCSHFQVVKDPISYFRLFESPKRYRMDASHVYFSNPESAPVIHELFPDAKFVLILRHPNNRAYSLYRHMRRHKHGDGQPLELIESFTDALREEHERHASKDFFQNCRHYFWNFMYQRSSLYDEQLARYLALFDRERFHVLSLAELRADPLAEMTKIADHLGIAPAPFSRADLSARNSSFPSEAAPPESAAILSKAFDGLTERTNKLVGRPIDWAL